MAHETSRVPLERRTMDHKVFPIARGSSAALWFCGVIGLFARGRGLPRDALLLRVADCDARGLGPGLAHPRRHVRAVHPEGGLAGRGGEGPRLGAEPGYTPASRTNGIGLPNYQSGWFRLANGSTALLS